MPEGPFASQVADLMALIIFMSPSARSCCSAPAGPRHCCGESAQPGGKNARPRLIDLIWCVPARILVSFLLGDSAYGILWRLPEPKPEGRSLG